MCTHKINVFFALTSSIINYDCLYVHFITSVYILNMCLFVTLRECMYRFSVTFANQKPCSCTLIQSKYHSNKIQIAFGRSRNDTVKMVQCNFGTNETIRISTSKYIIVVERICLFFVHSNTIRILAEQTVNIGHKLYICIE